MRPIRSPSDTVKQTFWNSEVIPYRFASPWALMMGTKSRYSPGLSLDDECAKPSSFSVMYFGCARPSMALRSFSKNHIRFYRRWVGIVQTFIMAHPRVMLRNCAAQAVAIDAAQASTITAENAPLGKAPWY